jgi:hypothetical protein
MRPFPNSCPPARITLRQLLSMSAGFTDEQTGPRLADGKVASILKLPLQADPGWEFIHSNPGRSLAEGGVDSSSRSVPQTRMVITVSNTHPDRWLDTDELIYMINTVITPVPR